MTTPQKLPKFSIRKKRTKPTQVAAPLSCPVPPRPKLRKQDRDLLLECETTIREAKNLLWGLSSLVRDLGQGHDTLKGTRLHSTIEKCGKLEEKINDHIAENA